MPTALSRTRKGDGDTPIDVALRALADPTRREILVLLRNGRQQAAGEIAAAFPAISRPAVSQHLSVLHGAALVTVQRDGNRRLYQFRPEGLADARAFIEQMWPASLRRLKDAAERAQRATSSEEQR